MVKFRPQYNFYTFQNFLDTNLRQDLMRILTPRNIHYSRSSERPRYLDWENFYFQFKLSNRLFSAFRSSSKNKSHSFLQLFWVTSSCSFQVFWVNYQNIWQQNKDKWKHFDKWLPGLFVVISNFLEITTYHVS